jgi:hypothetical protein
VCGHSCALIMESNVFRGCVISAFGELRDLRRLDREGLNLIDKLVRGEVRRFPVLRPTGG